MVQPVQQKITQAPIEEATIQIPELPQSVWELIFSALINQWNPERGFDRCCELRLVCHNFKDAMLNVFSHNAKYIGPVALERIFNRREPKALANKALIQIPSYLSKIPLFADMEGSSTAPILLQKGLMHSITRTECTAAKIEILARFFTKDFSINSYFTKKIVYY